MTRETGSALGRAPRASSLLALLVAFAHCAATGRADERYIISFPPGLTLADAELDAALSHAPGKPIVARHKFKHGINGFSASLSDEHVLYLESLGGIVEPDYPTTVDAAIGNQWAWGIDRIDQDDLPLNQDYTSDYDGTGVDLFVLDTGIFEHSEVPSSRFGDGIDLVDDDDDPMVSGNCNPHGTGVASVSGGRTIGVAPGATIHNVRVSPCQGNGIVETAIRGIIWVIEHPAKMKVITLSISSPMVYSFTQVASLAMGLGVVVVTSAGNQGDDACILAPAASKQVITVSAVGLRDEASPFANAGDCVDIFAPGEGIAIASTESPNSYSRAWGTSVACPHAAGVAVLFAQRLGPEKFTAMAVREMMIEESIKGRLTDSRADYALPGRNIPNRILRIPQMKPWPPPAPPAPPSPPPFRGHTIKIYIETTSQSSPQVRSVPARAIARARARDASTRPPREIRVPRG
jgi:subtilisin family serine protease